jgi:N-methylhydantoinase A
MSLNVAVDIGGTFTDLIGYDEATQRIYQAKSPTTPRELTQGIFECLRKGGVNISRIDNFIHGTTTAINIVVERKGTQTALVTTLGTRDVYKIGRGNRPEGYNIYFKRPTPLVPRHLTFEIEERMLANGEVMTPFNPDQAQEVADRIAKSNVEAVAVCFLHSWANPGHESLMGEVLRRAMPGCYVTLSHEILREYGEYERTSTTVINSYIGPKISEYIDHFERSLADCGFRGRLLIMQSNGGVMSPATARRSPVSMLESGPVGGFIAAARIGRRLGFENVIALDVGGTTVKTNLIKDGEPQMAHGYHIGGYASGHPMLLPVVDAVEIGSGGGSIAWIDDVGALKVGPQSAGSEPGPICYGRGGADPTITDANLLVGRLSANDFLGGEMPLDVEAAKEGLTRKVSSAIGLSAIQTALAITKIAVMNMSLAVRGISVERGYDPRDFVLVAFGGAGALHAAEVARELHIPTVIVPNYPAHFSALGMLMADIKHDYVRTYYAPLKQADFREVLAICKELMRAGSDTLKAEAIPSKEMIFQRFLDIRYSGQEFSIPVPILAVDLERGDSEAIRKAFDDLHERRYGYHAADQEAEIINIRLGAIGKRKQIEFPPMKFSRKENPLIGKRKVYVDNQKASEFSIYQREKMESGFKVSGPAIIQEYASTSLLLPGDEAVVMETGELVIHIEGGANGN